MLFELEGKSAVHRAATGRGEWIDVDENMKRKKEETRRRILGRKVRERREE